MKYTRIDPSWHETGWFHDKDAHRARDDRRETEPVFELRRRRGGAAKALGVLAIAGLSAVAGWMAATTSLRGPVAHGGMLGSATQLSLAAGSPLADELAEQRVRLSEEARESPMISWETGPALAEADPQREVEAGEESEISYPASALDPKPSNPDDADELWQQATDL